MRVDGCRHTTSGARIGRWRGSGASHLSILTDALAAGAPRQGGRSSRSEASVVTGASPLISAPARTVPSGVVKR